jgi:hypothetical protein
LPWTHSKVWQMLQCLVSPSLDLRLLGAFQHHDIFLGVDHMNAQLLLNPRLCLNITNI